MVVGMFDGNFYGSKGHLSIERAKVTIEDSCKNIIPFTIRIYNVLNCTLRLDKASGLYHGGTVIKTRKTPPADLAEMEDLFTQFLQSDVELTLIEGELTCRNTAREFRFLKETT